MFRSIRGKLLAWLSSIVVVVIVLFGGLTYFSVRRSLERDIDEELLELMATLAAVVTPDVDGSFLIELEAEQVEIFQQESEQTPYYRIWDVERNIVDSSHPERSIPYPESLGGRNRNSFREVIIEGADDSRILLGQSIRDHISQLRRLATTLIAIGGVMLLIMFGGGWMLTAKTLAPISRISDTAAAISDSNLSERIDLKDMETELAQLSRTINSAFDRIQVAYDRQTRFTADASHELRTPLSIVLAHCDLVLKGDRSQTEYRDALNAIRRAGRRMKGVVEGLLTLARADAGQVVLSKEVLDLKEVVEEACQMLAPLIDEKRIALSKDLMSTSVSGDRNLISEAVGNLLANATQYNRDDGRIDVTLRAREGIARLTICDTGLGIPKSDQPHLFDRFYQVDKSRTRMAGRGSGLGLAITKWIVEAHGGDIEFTSEEGVGSEFVLTCPSGKRA